MLLAAVIFERADAAASGQSWRGGQGCGKGHSFSAPFPAALGATAAGLLSPHKGRTGPSCSDTHSLGLPWRPLRGFLPLVRSVGGYVCSKIDQEQRRMRQSCSPWESQAWPSKAGLGLCMIVPLWQLPKRSSHSLWVNSAPPPAPLKNALPIAACLGPASVQ